MARRRARKQSLPEHWAVVTRAELRGQGMTSRDIAAALHAGHLVRPWKNAYLRSDVDESCRRAVAAGGRLACVSELIRWGVFVLDHSALHIAVVRTSSRLPDHSGVRRHWTLTSPEGWASVGIVDALVQAMVCQPVRAAIATLDSALNLGLIDRDQLHAVLVSLPRRLRIVRRLIDARAESGAKTFMRLILRTLGCAFGVQVVIATVGRVDFVVDGWLIIECDSKAHHASWEQQREDRRRDQAAATLGFATYRPIAEDIFWHAETVVAALRGLLALRSAVLA